MRCSDPKPGRTLLDWADDVTILADRLGLDRFSIFGVSGGGPGVLACAWKMPRPVRVGVVAGAAPKDVPGVFDGMSAVNRLFMRLAWRAPWLSRLNTRLLASIIGRNPGRYIDAMQRKVHLVDRAVLAQPGIRDLLVRDFTEALREGGQGMSDDMAANHGRPWGFALDRIETKVLFCYCALDRSVPPAMGRYLGRAVPGSEFHLLRDAGHLWVLLHLGEVLCRLMRSGPQTSGRPGTPSDRPAAWRPAGSVPPEESSS